MSKFCPTTAYQIAKNQFEFLCYETKVVLKKIDRCQVNQIITFDFLLSL